MEDFEQRKRELLTPVMVQAGAALMDCQGFEYGMALLLFHFSRLGAKGLNPDVLSAIMEDKEKKTAGQLFAMIRKHLGPSENLVEALQEGIKARNRLIHRVLIDNIERFPVEVERKKVIREIQELRAKVQRANDSIKPFVVGLSHGLDGVDPDVVMTDAISTFLSDARRQSTNPAKPR